MVRFWLVYLMCSAICSWYFCLFSTLQEICCSMYIYLKRASSLRTNSLHHLLMEMQFEASFWHKGLLFKLSQNNISGSLLKILSNFLRNIKQRVVANAETSIRENIIAGISLGTMPKPLLFLIYINDLSDGYLLKQNYLLIMDLYSLWRMTQILLQVNKIKRGLAIGLSSGRWISILTQINRHKK